MRDPNVYPDPLTERYCMTCKEVSDVVTCTKCGSRTLIQAGIYRAWVDDFVNERRLVRWTDKDRRYTILEAMCFIMFPGTTDDLEILVGLDDKLLPIWQSMDDHLTNYYKVIV